MIECCQLFHLLSLSNYYTEKALSRFVSYSTFTFLTDNLQSVMSRCSDIQFGLDDLATYVHLLNVALNTKLLLGKIEDALHLGIISLCFYNLLLLCTKAVQLAPSLFNLCQV